MKNHEPAKYHMISNNKFDPSIQWKAQQILTIAIDWFDGLIGPSGLLLLIYHLLCSPFQFYGWGLEILNN
jgi:hypothetical protein